MTLHKSITVNLTWDELQLILEALDVASGELDEQVSRDMIALKLALETEQ